MKTRAEVQKQLEQNNAGLKFDVSIREIVENSAESGVFDIEAENCIECQACTRICPTCHCFYLYDTKQKDYFARMKMWDSCMRLAYATVAGGANPHKYWVIESNTVLCTSLFTSSIDMESICALAVAGASTPKPEAIISGVVKALSIL